MILASLAPFLFILGQWGMGPGPEVGHSRPPAAPVLVQSTSNFLFSAGGVSVPYTSSVTSGNLLVAYGWVNVGSACLATVSDTKGNTWANGTCEASGNGGLIWYCLSANSSGADTVTISGGGGNWYSLHIMEFQGASSGLDGAATNFVVSSITSSGPVTGTDLIIGAAGNGGSADTYTTPTGFTPVQFVNGSFGITSQTWYQTAYQTSGTPTFTTSPAGHLSIVALKM